MNAMEIARRGCPTPQPSPSDSAEQRRWQAATTCAHLVLAVGGGAVEQEVVEEDQLARLRREVQLLALVEARHGRLVGKDLGCADATKMTSSDHLEAAAGRGGRIEGEPGHEAGLGVEPPPALRRADVLQPTAGRCYSCWG